MENKNIFFGVIGGSILVRFCTNQAFVFPVNEGVFSNRVRDRFIMRNDWVLDEGYELQYEELEISDVLDVLRGHNYEIVNVTE